MLARRVVLPRMNGADGTKACVVPLAKSMMERIIEHFIVADRLLWRWPL